MSGAAAERAALELAESSSEIAGSLRMFGDWVTAVRWWWFAYGRPKTETDRDVIEHTVEKARARSSSDVDRLTPKWTTSG